MAQPQSARYEQRNPKPPLEFEVADGVFAPTKTSNILISSVLRRIKQPGATLDLGCGSGYVGIVLAKQGLVAGPLRASDRSAEAVQCCERNAARHGVECDARAGSLFDCWSGEKFDLIVDDVSGVAEKIAELSSWFPGSSHCGAGPDGTELTNRILETTPAHLRSGGAIIFPVLSLSNADRIVGKARDVFHQVDFLADQYFPLSGEIGANIDVLHDMMADGLVKIRKIGDKWAWWTAVYLATKPR